MNPQRMVLSFCLALGLCLVWCALPAAAQNQNVTVDDQPTAEQRLDEVNDLRRARRFDQAVELMQELVDGVRFKLVGVDEGQYADAERWCREQLLRDPALQAAYRSRFTATASRSLEQAAVSDERIEALGEVYRRYTITAPGLEAGKRLAGLLLEAGEASSAAALVEQLMRHPDHETSLERLLMLRGAAAAYTHDTKRYDDTADRLEAIGKPEQARWLSALRQSIEPGLQPSRLAIADLGASPEPVTKALWTQPLAIQEVGASWLMRDVFTLPAVTPSLSLVNNGRQIVGFDRASGQRVWAYPADDAESLGLRPGGQRWYDARSVAIGGGLASAVLGECYGITESRNPYVKPNTLACVDRQTGKLQWERFAGQLDEGEPLLADDRRAGRVNLQHTHFVGTPIIARGKVLALLRRTSSQGSQSIWLVCYRAGDGAMLWYRHLSLVSLSYSRDTSKTTPQIALHGETIYLSDGVATVGSVDFQSGGYNWLRVLPVGFGTNQRLTVATRGVLSPPVLTRAGLLVSLSLANEPMVLLDPDDGSVLQTFEGHPTLSGTRYMLDAEGGAVIVGYDKVSYWDEGDAELAWTFSLAPDENTVGRGDVSLRYIVMPTNQRVLVLDRKTGQVISDNAQAPGNVLVTNIIARGGDLFAIHEGGLSLFASWDSVYSRLEKRVEQSPDDPSGGIAIATLAMRQEGMDQAVLQGVGYAINAVRLQPRERSAPVRERVFEQLRLLAKQPEANNVRGRLYDQMALVSQTASQEVAYHMDVGRFLVEQGQPSRAVEHFHAVLAEPAFAAQPYVSDGASRLAGAAAQQQIQALIREHGRSIYARQDALAQAWLEQVKARGDVDAALLTGVARRFPLSLAAVQVLIEAAQLNEQRGAQMQALTLYQQAVARANDPEQRQRAIGMMLLFCIENGRTEVALDLIDKLMRFDGELQPLEDGKPVELSSWHERVRQARSQMPVRSDAGPSLGSPLRLPGRLVGFVPGVAPPADLPLLLLTHGDNTLSCHDPEDPAQPMWSRALPVGVERLDLIDVTPEQILCWDAAGRQILALSPNTGQLRWSRKIAFEDGQDQVRRRPQQVAQDPVLGGLLIAVADGVVCVADRQRSGVMAIDRAGGSLLWQTRLGMSQITAIDIDNWSVAIAGPAGSAQQLRSGKVAVFDLFNAVPINAGAFLTVGLTPNAVRLHQDGLIVLGRSGLTRIDQVSGSVRWARQFPEAELTGLCVVTDQCIAVTATNGMLYAVAPDYDGQVLGQFLIRSASQPDEVIMRPDGDRVFVVGGKGLFCLGGQTGLQWRDAVAEPDQYPAGVLVGHALVTMITRTPPINDQPERIRLYLFEREGGRLAARYELDGLEGQADPGGAQLIGSNFLIPMGNQTLLIPSDH